MCVVLASNLHFTNLTREESEDWTQIRVHDGQGIPQSVWQKLHRILEQRNKGWCLELWMKGLTSCSDEVPTNRRGAGRPSWQPVLFLIQTLHSAPQIHPHTLGSQAGPLGRDLPSLIPCNKSPGSNSCPCWQQPPAVLIISPLPPTDIL